MSDTPHFPKWNHVHDDTPLPEHVNCKCFPNMVFEVPERTWLEDLPRMLGLHFGMTSPTL